MSGGNEPEPDESDELVHSANENGGGDGDGGGDDTDDLPSWGEIKEMYQNAGDVDDRLTPRFVAKQKLLADTSWRTISDNDVLWRYDSETGIYRDDGEAHLREKLTNHLREQYRTGEQREITAQVKGATTISPEELGGDENYICTKNYVLEIDGDTVTTHEHSPKYEFVARVQTEYDPDADCPRFKAFLQEAIDSGAARNTLQEYAGYCLKHWCLPHHKTLFIVGPTASGKSTFLDTIRAMLGDDSVASLTPQQMTGERFGGAELFKSWANIRNDIPADVIRDTGQFKEIAAGDPIKAERKYQDPFKFEPTCKHLFSANQLPDAETNDEAFFRRILLVAFPSTVPRGQRDPHLDDKLSDELSGVLNWAIEGLKRLEKNGRFSQDRLPGATQETWERWGKSVKRFAKLCLDTDGEEKIPKSTLHEAFVEFCDDNGIPSSTQHKMTQELKKLKGFTEDRDYVNGGRQRVFAGLDWTGRGEQYRDQANRDSSGDERTGGQHIDDY
jgi:putative DNA primase/helicase